MKSRRWTLALAFILDVVCTNMLKLILEILQKSFYFQLSPGPWELVSCTSDWTSIRQYCSPAANYIIEVDSRNTRIRCEICSKLTVKTLLFWCLYCWLWTYLTPCSSVSIVNFEQVKYWLRSLETKLFKKMAKVLNKDIDGYVSIGNFNPLSANFAKWSNTLKHTLTILWDWRLKG